MLKFPRTIRLDPSDTFVFERAAEPGEWAVSGAFVFWNRDPATLAQKQRVALRSGFLGIDSWGWSTLAIVTEATEAEREMMIQRLASSLVKKFGAPTSRPRASPPGKRSRSQLRCASTRRRRCSPFSAALKMVKSANAFARSSRARLPQMPTGCTRMPAPLPSMTSKVTLNPRKRSIFSG